MAEFQEVIKEWNRMCKTVPSCYDCPLKKVKDEKLIEPCRKFMTDYPEDAERVIMTFAAENPILTNRKKFKEVFGFDILERFSFYECNKEQLNKEYKKSDNND